MSARIGVLAAGIGVMIGAAMVPGAARAEQAALSVTVQVVAPCTVNTDDAANLPSLVEDGPCGTVAVPRIAPATPQLERQIDAVRASYRVDPGDGAERVLSIIY